MSQHAVVIGAGIAGPTAVIALQRNGYKVTCYEARPENAPGSNHVISLDSESESYLYSLGIKRSEIYRYSSQPWRMEESYGMEKGRAQSASGLPPSVVWNDLRTALVKRCAVNFGTRITAEPECDLIIWADGIGSQGRKIHTSETGRFGCEMVYRGVRPRPASDMTWFNYRDGKDGTWEIVSYPTWDTATNEPLRGFTMFTNMSTEPWRNTRKLSRQEINALCVQYRPSMHSGPYRLLREATEILAAPQMWWDGLEHMTFPGVNGKGRAYLIGDAAGTVSPRTASGANSAIAEAFNIPTMEPRLWDTRFTSNRQNVLSLTRELQAESGLQAPRSIHG